MVFKAVQKLPADRHLTIRAGWHLLHLTAYFYNVDRAGET